MSEYRLYLFNELGHVRGRFVLHCGSEIEALSMVEKHRSEREMELWCGDRLVQSYPALEQNMAQA
jgi:hypothetical protein